MFFTFAALALPAPVYLSSSEEGWASEGSLGGLNPSFRRYPGPEETGGVPGARGAIP